MQHIRYIEEVLILEYISYLILYFSRVYIWFFAIFFVTKNIIYLMRKKYNNINLKSNWDSKLLRVCLYLDNCFILLRIGIYLWGD